MEFKIGAFYPSSSDFVWNVTAYTTMITYQLRIEDDQERMPDGSPFV